MKVGELKVGMMITPAVNKWTQSKGRFRLKMRDSILAIKGESSIPSTQETIPILVAEVCARPILKSDRYFDYAIYMGFEKTNQWLHGVKKHHMLLIGNNLARITGYEFRYIDKVPEIECINES